MSSNEAKAPLLRLQDLVVKYTSGGNTVNAVNGVTLELDAGKTLGLVGETGAGKTTIAKSIMRILPDHAVKSVEGQVFLKGEDLLTVSDAVMRTVRGGRISMVFQDPMTALNPVRTVSNQIAESIKLHQRVDRRESLRMAVGILEKVGIGADRADEYPHQFSGGMKQRVIIALAISCHPEILIADEPTTALDVTIQAQVLELIAKLRDDLGTAMILITHDLGVVAEICDAVAVVYAGRIVESGSKEAVFDNPAHPYTKGLFGALPDLYKDVRRLSPIEGLPPDPTNLPTGCAFHPRCAHVSDECRGEEPPIIQVAPGHVCRCSKAVELMRG